MPPKRRCPSRTDPKHTPWPRLVLAVLLWFSLAGLNACASLPPTQPPSEDQTVYRSRDYVVYTGNGQRSAAELADEFLGDAQKSWMIEEANAGGDLRGGGAIVIPLKIRNKGGLNRKGFQAVPVLTYHRFGDNCDSPLCMPAEVFEAQLGYLKKNGYHSVTPEEMLDFLQYRRALPKKSVWITMDDGYRSTYQVAYPLLKKYGFTATLFIYTDFVGASRLAVTWSQL